VQYTCCDKWLNLVSHVQVFNPLTPTVATEANHAVTARPG